MQKIDEIKIYKESEIRIHFQKVRDNRTRAELTENTMRCARRLNTKTRISYALELI